ncbi:extracellular solute-binding protein [Aureimonas leprariae]|uniref:Extracellular solute-binding protein n=1 Tax=Plantimonas leprariae TaxID=2615207 RepID=A0A7V7TVC2_9HYPH|nr:extracellular solute-binding protein [Aureimonas leprariae]
MPNGVARSLAALGLLALSGLAAAADTLPERFADLYSAASKEGEVVFYNAYRKETNAALSAFWRENFPDVALKIVQKQTLDLIPAIEAEKAAGATRPDVVLINEKSVADDWVKRDFLEPYEVKEFHGIEPEFKQASGAYYVPTVFLLTAAYNTETYPDASALPKKLADFADPKWKDQLTFSDPKVAASNLTFLIAFLDTKKTDWETLAKLAAQNILFNRGNAESVRILASGERTLSPMTSSQNVVTAKEQGQPIDFYVLDEGAVVVEQQSAIFKGGPHPAAAKLLQEVLVSPEGQTLVAKAGSYWPTSEKATPPDRLPKLEDLKPLYADVEIGGDEAKQVLAKFGEVFGRK